MLCRLLDFLVAMAAVELVLPGAPPPIFASTVSFRLFCEMECRGMAMTVYGCTLWSMAAALAAFVVVVLPLPWWWCLLPLRPPAALELLPPLRSKLSVLRTLPLALPGFDGNCLALEADWLMFRWLLLLLFTAGVDEEQLLWETPLSDCFLRLFDRLEWAEAAPPAHPGPPPPPIADLDCVTKFYWLPPAAISCWFKC